MAGYKNLLRSGLVIIYQFLYTAKKSEVKKVFFCTCSIIFCKKISKKIELKKGYFYTCYTIFLKTYQNSISISIFFAETEIKHTITISNIWSCSENLAQGYFSKLDLHWNQSGNCSMDKFYKTGVKNFFFKIWFYL